MSRGLTAAQIVAAGDYLTADFDPGSLTVNQLLGVFGYHNITFPGNYTKPKLVDLFNDSIKANATKLRRERVNKANSIASDEGITNGHTGELLRQKAPPAARRTSRRLSREPTAASEEDAPPQPEPTKRRRSSAQPSLGGPSKRKVAVPVVPVVLEEESEAESPVRKVLRARKSIEGPKSTGLSDFPDDSGWEDNNVFQSGTEDSPMRPVPPKPRASRRSSAAPKPPRRSRKASSAPPQTSSSPPPGSPPRELEGLPESAFEPELPPEVRRDTAAIVRATPPRVTPPRASPAPHRPVLAVPSVVAEQDEPADEDLVASPAPYTPMRPPLPHLGDATMEVDRYLAEDAEEGEEEEDEGAEGEIGDEDLALVHEGPEDGKALVRQRPKRAARPWYLTLLYGVLASALGSVVLQFKGESAALGFCDPGTQTNDLILERQLERQAVEECNRLNRTTLLSLPDGGDGSVGTGALCPAPPLVPLHPEACTPCPDHASCSRYTVACDYGYILRPHLALSLLPPPPPSSPSSASGAPVSPVSELIWTAISRTCDGLPGLGPIAFPPRCVVDSKRRNRIGKLGQAIDVVLAQERGRRMCTGELEGITVSEEEGGDARKWGLELDKLRNFMKEKTSSDILHQFDAMFAEAVDGLTKIGDVIISADAQGKTYLARETGEMSWNCALTVKARDTWRQWRTNVILSALSLISAFLFRERRAARLIEDKRVGELVQVALDTLRNQELAHHTDPASAPAPYLPSHQLRDLVLQDEHSVAARAALWARVERVVEANANVRANLEETAAGDEMRVWRWIGGASHQSPAS